MTDAITQLKDDHEKVEKLFKKYEDTTDRAIKTRRKLVDQMIEELTVAPASTVLNGYTLTPWPTWAFSPTKHSSPNTEPSSQRALRRRSDDRPMTAPRRRTPSAR